MITATPTARTRRPGDAELIACRELMRGGSKSFFTASLLLPARVRGLATGLYAFCRVADDAIDGSTEPGRAIAQLHERLDAVYADRPGPELADRALACVVQRCAIPRLLLDALLEGFEWDVRGHHYDTIEDLHAYGARVALLLATRGGGAQNSAGPETGDEFERIRTLEAEVGCARLGVDVWHLGRPDAGYRRSAADTLASTSV